MTPTNQTNTIRSGVPVVACYCGEVCFGILGIGTFGCLRHCLGGCGSIMTSLQCNAGNRVRHFHRESSDAQANIRAGGLPSVLTPALGIQLGRGGVTLWIVQPKLFGKVCVCVCAT
eukprot:3941583-Amphidinium_carterae.2